MTRTLATFEHIATGTSLSQLAILGIAAPKPDDPVPAGTRSIILLGPKEPGFWQYITRQPEFHDQSPDPVDRWSTRAISKLAEQFGGAAVFPFSGPPYAPFTSWALTCGTAWASPVGLLVHADAGLFLSFRGALALPYPVQVPASANRPCNTCAAKPCATACPVNALHPDGYDLETCHTYLDTPAGQDCLDNGCAARRACPVSQSYGRQPAQSAHHMKAFHP